MLSVPHRTKGSGSRRATLVRSALVPGLLLTASCGTVQTADPPAPPVATASDCTVTIPALAGRVTDLADVLPPAREAAISTRLETLERAKGAQLVVVTVTSLNGRPIEEFTQCHGNHWGVGSKDGNDGVVLLVAPNERKVRIEVGLGLENALTDAEAQRVLDEEVIPRFRNQDFPGGIDAGVVAIIKEIG